MQANTLKGGDTRVKIYPELDQIWTREKSDPDPKKIIPDPQHWIQGVLAGTVSASIEI